MGRVSGDEEQAARFELVEIVDVSALAATVNGDALPAVALTLVSLNRGDPYPMSFALRARVVRDLVDVVTSALDEATDHVVARIDLSDLEDGE